VMWRVTLPGSWVASTKPEGRHRPPARLVALPGEGGLWRRAIAGQGPGDRCWLITRHQLDDQIPGGSREPRDDAASQDQPLVVLLDQQHAGEADRRGVVREDADDVGAPADLRG